MRFGPVALNAAEGAVLAHSLMVGGRKLGKGRVLTAADLAGIAAEGFSEVTVARLDPGDVGEDMAAARLASALLPDPDAAGLRFTSPHAGRVNLYAVGSGIVDLDVDAIHALNRIDAALTLAVLAPYTRVTEGMLVGTVKVIAYAVAGTALETGCRVASGAVRVRPVVRRSAGLILTEPAGDKLAEKGREAVAGRLRSLGMDLAEVVVARHDVTAVAEALGRLSGEMVLILTGAATSDLYDVAPEAVRRAGGSVARFGMPVDPGNLLFHGTLNGRPVIGLPGCARSPALNGADWVLERLACGLKVTDDDIAAMGVGGLLKEIPIRPQPREGRRGRDAFGGNGQD
ncbi:molybdopterin-binding protein [Defluviimonas sp. WL0050]|uniref:Molybdopterin-binding protein n=1 Tax=Albidovulum litorale TaxID=2984134 RepID=A0ABT2ZIK3_9RHOB|nr:molybdopterin-binding protein [Defluviimonas sp. WL0050]MCV2870949.1 molybdopterin-binding protein [Defluviimonas sp. WL0050]